jgi:uncharacterized protein
VNDFTIACWVRLTALTNWSRIFDFGTGTTANMFFTPCNGSGTARFAITTGGAGAEQSVNAPSALPAGTWTHVAVTLQGNLCILYVNRLEAARNAAVTLRPSGLGATTADYLGRSQYADPYLNGQLDDFRLYSRALTAGGIGAL